MFESVSTSSSSVESPSSPMSVAGEKSSDRYGVADGLLSAEGAEASRESESGSVPLEPSDAVRSSSATASNESVMAESVAKRLIARTGESALEVANATWPFWCVMLLELLLAATGDDDDVVVVVVAVETGAGRTASDMRCILRCVARVTTFIDTAPGGMAAAAAVGDDEIAAVAAAGGTAFEVGATNGTAIGPEAALAEPDFSSSRRSFSHCRSRCRCCALRSSSSSAFMA